MTLQEKVEDILKVDPKMPTRMLMRKFMERHTRLLSPVHKPSLEELLDFTSIVPTITRRAANYRQNLGIRDEVREQMNEQQRRFWPEQPSLEANPPTLNLSLQTINQPH